MEYWLKNISYPSSNGTDDISAYIYAPIGDDAECKGIVQIVHGMAEYFLRYEPFCVFLARQGYVVCGNDHLGHGSTADHEEALGYTAEKDGKDILASDVNRLSEIVKEEYPGIPHILLGHSMGSLIARYCISIFPDITDSCIIMGTVGPGNPAKLGRLTAKLNMSIFGGYHRSNLLQTLALGTYTKGLGRDEPKHAWISSDVDVIAKYGEDPLCGFNFTSQGYYDLFDLVDAVNRAGWADTVDKSLPILLVSGRQDPCGDYGRGVVKVCEMLLAADVKNVRCKIYPNSRHEILNDIERKEVYSDIFSWVSQICDGMKAEKENA